MKFFNCIVLLFSVCSTFIFAQENYLPQDYLSKEFHKDRRALLREQLPKNSVAVFFANAVRNRSNDVEYVYHQDPNFYYLTGYKEPHALLFIFKDNQVINGKTFNELIFVQERDIYAEMWTGKRLGVTGVQDNLGFKVVYNGTTFESYDLDFSKFEHILFQKFENDVRNTSSEADLYDLINIFKGKISYNLMELETPIQKEKYAKTVKKN